MVRELRGRRTVARVGTLVGILLFTLAVLGVVFTAWRTIEPGYVGIVFDKASHRVTNTLDPGWVLINPLTQSITRYPVGLQTIVMVRTEGEGTVQGDDSIRVGSREGQTLFADVSVQYTVERDHAADLYQTWAGAPIERIEENLVRQVTRSALNDVASTYGWEDMFGAKRVEYTQKVSGELQRRFGEKFVKFESLNLRGWHLPENLQRALDAKIAAQQAAEQQQFALNQAKIKAEQDKVTAEGQANATRAQAQGEADATRIRAEGDAQATLTRAKAQAEANGQLSKSLTPDLISYQQLQRWDGKLPLFSSQQNPPLVGATESISGTATR